MTEKIHKFEIAGLGFAPFKFVGIWEMPSRGFQANYPNQYNRMIASAPCRVGSCNYCGMGITVHYLVKDMNGKVSAVGSECINKAGNAGLINAARHAKNKRIREKKQIKQQRQRDAQLYRERQIYAGVTKGEAEYMWEQIFKDREEQQRLDALQPVLDILIPMADCLQDGQRGFCDSIADTLRKAELPRGRGLDIMLEILAKQYGRRNSKAYKAAYNHLAADVMQAALMIDNQ